AFAVDRVDVAALQLVARRERDRVDQDVEAVPVLAELCEESVDLRVVRNIERQHDLALLLGRELAYALGQLVVLVAEGELRAFAPQRIGDAPCDRAMACEAHDDGALAGEKSHERTLLS